ncbi:MAG: hypothetical protein ACI9P7_000918 [Candidatus Azotimanducaceae bacterium]|jgi:hypothetical protein
MSSFTAEITRKMISCLFFILFCVSAAKAYEPNESLGILVASDLLNECATPSSTIKCPSAKAFADFAAHIQSDQGFQEAKEKGKRRQSIDQYLRQRNQSKVTMVMNHSLRNLDATTWRGSEESLLGAALDGVNHLHFGRSTSSMIRVSAPILTFLVGFTDQDNRLVFGDIITRARAAVEVFSMGANPSFLLSRDEWLFEGKRVEFLAGDEALATILFSLADFSEHKAPVPTGAAGTGRTL